LQEAGIENRWLAYNADMTLGEAVAMKRSAGWACACVGPPYPSLRDTPCYCRLGAIACEELHRTAHIAVKMLDEVARRQG
jgi:hypothetical protein